MLGALIMQLLSFGQPGAASRVAAMEDFGSVLCDVREQALGANEAKKSGLDAGIQAGGLVRVPSEMSEDDGGQPRRGAGRLASELCRFKSPRSHHRLPAPPT